jgi:SAM-dependent methyltransferase
MFTVGLNNESSRDAWIKETLTSLPSGITLLDAGAGECPYKKWCSHLHYIAQDFGQYDGSGGEGLQTGTWDNSRLDIVSDITAIPMEDASVDAILCTEVLEHLPDPLKALQEFKRLLRPNGYLIITAPFISFTHFAPYHFSTGMSRFYYQHHLPLLGFEIERMDPNGNFFELVAQENRRVKWVLKKYAGKKMGWFGRLLIQLNLFMLQRYAKWDRGSSDLACYGYHVVARKKDNK